MSSDKSKLLTMARVRAASLKQIEDERPSLDAIEEDFVHGMREQDEAFERAQHELRQELAKQPQWKALFDDPHWQLFEEQYRKVKEMRATACKEWHDRGYEWLSEEEQARVRQVQKPYDDALYSIEMCQFEMQRARGLIENISSGFDISSMSLADLQKQIEQDIVVADMLGDDIRGNSNLAQRVAKYRQRCEQHQRYVAPDLKALMDQSDDLLMELQKLYLWLRSILTPQTDNQSAEDQASSAQADDKFTLRVCHAARAIGCNSGVITRAANADKIESNGKTGRERRLSPKSVIEFATSRIPSDGLGESVEAVQKRIDQYVEE